MKSAREQVKGKRGKCRLFILNFKQIQHVGDESCNHHKLALERTSLDFLPWDNTEGDGCTGVATE